MNWIKKAYNRGMPNLTNNDLEKKDPYPSKPRARTPSIFPQDGSGTKLTILETPGFGQDGYRGNYPGDISGHEDERSKVDPFWNRGTEDKSDKILEKTDSPAGSDRAFGLGENGPSITNLDSPTSGDAANFWDKLDNPDNPYKNPLSSPRIIETGDNRKSVFRLFEEHSKNIN
jgi:hypothetical protein